MAQFPTPASKVSVAAVSVSKRGFVAALLGGAIAAPASAKSFVAAPPASRPAAKAPKAPAASGARAPFTAAEQAEAAVPGLPEARFPADEPAAYRAALGTAPAIAEEPWLVLSGGGENGAYGAGLLTGWTAAGTRPRFGVVTGISTGALIAPFAFAGPAFDAALKDAYTTISAADVFEFGATPESLLDTWPLGRMIARQVTPELLAAVAAGHREGRRLFVVTTNVDTGRPVAWNMGALAAAGTPEARKLFLDVLLASASIPGVFPPVHVAVEVGGRAFTEMHVDGGVTTPFYLAPESLVGEGRERVPARKVYVVVNNQLAPEFQVADRSTLVVLGRSLSAAVKAGTRAGLMIHGVYAARTGLELAVASIDERFAEVAAAPFDGGYMRRLFAHGARVASDATAFRGTGAVRVAGR